MKTKYYHSKTRRTDGHTSQPEFDNLLADLDISSLKFLNHKYKKEIRLFPSQFDLNEERNQKEYQRMLQRKHMISEELDLRMHDIMASPSYQDRGELFDPETGLVLDEYGDYKYAIAYKENIDSPVYESFDDADEDLGDPEDGFHYEYYIPRDRKSARKIVYENWNYIKTMDD